MAKALKFLADFHVVVDLAVVYQVVAPSGRCHRLPTGIGGVENRERAMQQQHFGFAVWRGPFPATLNLGTREPQPAVIVGPAVLYTLQNCRRTRRLAAAWLC